MQPNIKPHLNQNIEDQDKQMKIKIIIREDIKLMAIVFTPLIILKLLIQPFYFINSYIYSTMEVNNKLIDYIHEVKKINQIDSLKINQPSYYFAYLITFSVELLQISFYAIIAYQIYRSTFQTEQNDSQSKDILTQVNENEKEVQDDIVLSKESSPNENQQNKVQKTITDFQNHLFVIILVFEEQFIRFLIKNCSYLSLERKIQVLKVDEIIVNFLMYYIYIQFFEKQSKSYLKIFQLNVLSQILQMLGQMYFQNDLVQNQNLSYLRVIFWYQLFQTSCRCFGILYDDQIKDFDYLNEIQNMNKQTQIIDQIIENLNSLKACQLDSNQFVYIKDFFSVTFKDSNENLKQNMNLNNIRIGLLLQQKKYIQIFFENLFYGLFCKNVKYFIENFINIDFQMQKDISKGNVKERLSKQFEENLKDATPEQENVNLNSFLKVNLQQFDEDSINKQNKLNLYDYLEKCDFNEKQPVYFFNQELKILLKLQMQDSFGFEILKVEIFKQIIENAILQSNQQIQDELIENTEQQSNNSQHQIVQSQPKKIFQFKQFTFNEKKKAQNIFRLNTQSQDEIAQNLKIVQEQKSNVKRNNSNENLMNLNDPIKQDTIKKRQYSIDVFQKTKLNQKKLSGLSFGQYFSKNNEDQQSIEDPSFQQDTTGLISQKSLKTQQQNQNQISQAQLQSLNSASFSKEYSIAKNIIEDGQNAQQFKNELIQNMKEGENQKKQINQFNNLQQQDQFLNDQDKYIENEKKQIKSKLLKKQITINVDQRNRRFSEDRGIIGRNRLSSKKSLAQYVKDIVKDEKDKREADILKLILVSLENQYVLQKQNNINTPKKQSSDEIENNQMKKKIVAKKESNDKQNNNLLEQIKFIKSQIDQLNSNGIFNQKLNVRENNAHEKLSFFTTNSQANHTEQNFKHVALSEFKQSKEQNNITNHKSKSVRSLKIQVKSQNLQQLIDHYQQRIEQKETALEFVRKKLVQLKKDLDGNKIFLNMVVHDMRNPTNQIEFLITQTLNILRQILEARLNPRNLNGNEQNLALNRQGKGNQIEEEEKIQNMNDENFNSAVSIQPNIYNYRNNQMKSNHQDFSFSNAVLNRQNYNLVKNSLQFQQEISNFSEQPNFFSSKMNEENQIIKGKNRNRLNDQQRNNINPRNIEKEQINIVEKKQRINLKQLEAPSDELKEVCEQIDKKIDQIDQSKIDFYSKLKQQFEQKDDEQSNLQARQDLIQEEKLEEESMLQIDDQEPKISRQLANQKHLSYNPYLLYINDKKIKQVINNKPSQNNVLQVFSNLLQIQIIKSDENELLIQENNQIQYNHQIIKRQNDNNYNQDETCHNLKQQLETSIGYLESGKYCSVMIINLINDMMDLAKTEQMKFELNNEYFNLLKTVHRAFEMLSYFSNQKNIKPQLVIDQDVQHFFENINGDEGRFSQIFLNFLSNAFKFTPQNGQIQIEIVKTNEQRVISKEQKLLEKQKLFEMLKSQSQNLMSLPDIPYERNKDIDQILENQNRLLKKEINQIKQAQEDQDFEEFYLSFQIRIKDSGAGISQENIGKLFLNFGKLADTKGVNKSGTGLGLSICKLLIEKMGGKVHVESEGQGKGTTFIISMNTISKTKSQSQEQMFQPLKKSHSQIPIPVSLTFQNQKKAFFESSLQKNSKRAISVIDQIQGSQNSFMRIQEQCLSESKYSQIYSQNSIQMQQQPFNLQLLSQGRDNKSNHSSFLSQFHSQLSQNQPIDQVQDQKNYKVLVINDEFFTLQILALMLNKAEIKNVDQAQNGLEGFNQVKNKNYDFIICDLEMPVMDGFECAYQIKNFYSLSNQLFQQKNNNPESCPLLIACSANVNNEIEQKALSSGFDMAVQSPLTVQMIEEFISKANEKKEQNKKLENQLKLLEQQNDQSVNQEQFEQELDDNLEQLDLEQVELMINQLDQNLQFTLGNQVLEEHQQNNLQNSQMMSFNSSMIDYQNDDYDDQSEIFQESILKQIKIYNKNNSQKKIHEKSNFQRNQSIEEMIEEEDDDEIIFNEQIKDHLVNRESSDFPLLNNLQENKNQNNQDNSVNKQNIKEIQDQNSQQQQSQESIMMSISNKLSFNNFDNQEDSNHIDRNNNSLEFSIGKGSLGDIILKQINNRNSQKFKEGLQIVKNENIQRGQQQESKIQESEQDDYLNNMRSAYFQNIDDVNYIK